MVGIVCESRVTALPSPLDHMSCFPQPFHWESTGSPINASDTSRVLATLPEPNVRIRKSESATTPRDQRDREAKAQQHAATMRSATREVDDAGKLQYVEYEHGDGERTCSHHREQSRAIKSHQEPSRAIKNKREPSRAIKSNQE